MNKQYSADGLLISSFISFILGMILAAILMSLEWRKDVIKHGAAYYHSQTGDFTWKTNSRD